MIKHLRGTLKLRVQPLQAADNDIHPLGSVMDSLANPCNTLAQGSPELV